MRDVGHYQLRGYVGDFQMTLKGQPSAKKGKKHKYMDEIAYTVEHKGFGKFNVRKTANAWWLDKGKVEQLIEAKKMRLNFLESCYYAGITQDQQLYFLEQHPHFSPFFEALPMHPRVAAKITILKNLSDPDMARWYAEHAMRDEFGKRNELTGKDGQALISDDVMSKEEIKAMAEAILVSPTVNGEDSGE